MSFQNPQLLWLLLLLAVPLVLYLLRMPRRQVATSALFLWERFLRSERLGHTSERFRRALGLALCLLILASLLLAAAGPVVSEAPTAARRIAIVVDASASMNALSGGRSNLDRAKAAAGQLIESLGSGTEVAVAEAAGGLNVLAPVRSAGFSPYLNDRRTALRAVKEIAPFDGPMDLGGVLEEARRLWGDGVPLYVFTDSALPEGPWAEQVHAWVAPPAGDNAAIVALAAERRGKEILVRFALANYGSSPRALAATAFVNGMARRSSEAVTLQPGEAAERSLRIEEPGAAALQVKLDANGDALKADDEACAVVPSLDNLRVRVVWPDKEKRNAYVQAVLAALRDEGAIGPVTEGPGHVAATVFVDHAPAAWPDGGAIVLYPLRSGALQVKGLHEEPVTISRQARHELLRDVDLRGLAVKGAVEATLPDWAEPLAWAGELPVVWAGETGKTKALVVGIPLAPAGSRLPFAASFPVLMRNALQWMLPSPEIRRPGDRVGGWTSRRAGLVGSPVDGGVHAFSVLSAAESDLRRARAIAGESIPRRRPLAALFIVLAMALLPVEWGLFHKRVTE